MYCCILLTPQRHLTYLQKLFSLSLRSSCWDYPTTNCILLGDLWLWPGGKVPTIESEMPLDTIGFKMRMQQVNQNTSWCVTDSTVAHFLSWHQSPRLLNTLCPQLPPGIFTDLQSGKLWFVGSVRRALMQPDYFYLSRKFVELKLWRAARKNDTLSARRSAISSDVIRRCAELVSPRQKAFFDKHCNTCNRRPDAFIL